MAIENKQANQQTNNPPSATLEKKNINILFCYREIQSTFLKIKCSLSNGQFCSYGLKISLSTFPTLFIIKGLMFASGKIFL